MLGLTTVVLGLATVALAEQAARNEQTGGSRVYHYLMRAALTGVFLSFVLVSAAIAYPPLLGSG